MKTEFESIFALLPEMAIEFVLILERFEAILSDIVFMLKFSTTILLEFELILDLFSKTKFVIVFNLLSTISIDAAFMLMLLTS